MKNLKNTRHWPVYRRCFSDTVVAPPARATTSALGDQRLRRPSLIACETVLKTIFCTQANELAFSIALFYFFLLSYTAHAFLLPPEQILRNNAEQKHYLKSAVIVQNVEFLEGFFSPESFSCQETIYFKTPEALRIDYNCNGTVYQLLRTKKKSFSYYQKTTTPLEHRPIHSLLSLFLVRNPEILFYALAHDEFITAEIVTPEPSESPEDLKPSVAPETDWRIGGEISLKRLGKIEARTPTKLERNVDLVLTSPASASHVIWFDKDLYCPQKIEQDGKDLFLKNYQDKDPSAEKKKRNAFKYPQLIEIQEDAVTGITIRPQWEDCKVNSPLSEEWFTSSEILKKQVKPGEPLSESRRETLEKFIHIFRGLNVGK